MTSLQHVIRPADLLCQFLQDVIPYLRAEILIDIRKIIDINVHESVYHIRRFLLHHGQMLLYILSKCVRIIKPRQHIQLLQLSDFPLILTQLSAQCGKHADDAPQLAEGFPLRRRDLPLSVMPSDAQPPDAAARKFKLQRGKTADALPGFVPV